MLPKVAAKYMICSRYVYLSSKSANRLSYNSNASLIWNNIYTVGKIAACCRVLALYWSAILFSKIMADTDLRSNSRAILEALVPQ